MKLEPQTIIKRYKHSLEQKEGFKSLYESAFKMAMPQRNDFSNTSAGQKKTFGLFTSTGIVAVNKFVNRMQSSLTPPFKKWVELKSGMGIPKEIKKQVDVALDTITETAFTILHSSNFHVCMSEFYYDLAAGTACLMVMPGTKESQPINFVVMPINQISIESGAYGSVGAIFRCQKVAAMLIKKTWPDAKLTSEIENVIKDNPMSEIELVEAFYENEDKNYYDVIELKTGERLLSRSFSVPRVICTRLGKIAGEDWGRGPLTHALPDLLMLNKVNELGLRSAQLNAFGIYTVADSDVINPNTLVLNPGMFIPVSRNAGPNGPSIMPLPQAGNLNIQQFMVTELQEGIKSILLNNPLPPANGAVRSPTEFITRTQEFRIDSESFFGRLVYEFVQPLWNAILSILDERGVIQIPPELSKIDNLYVKINVISPIAKEQSYDDVQSIARSAEMIGAIGGEQAVMLSLKVEDIGEFVSEKLGVPAKLIRSAEERQEMTDKAAEQQQAAAQAQMQQAQQAQGQQQGMGL